MSQPDLEQVARRAVEAAQSAGADDAEAWVEEAVTRQIRVYEEQVESLTDAGSRGIGLRVFLDGRSGYAYGTDMSDEGIKVAGVGGARERRRWRTRTSSAACPTSSAPPRLRGSTPPGWPDWSTERKIELAVEIERAARSHEGVSQVEDTVYADADGSVALANSRGFCSSYEASSAWAYASVFAGEGADLMTGLGVGLGREPGELDARAIGDEAARARARSSWAPASRRAAAARWCSTRSWPRASSASSAGCCPPTRSSAGRSLFADREGDEIASRRLRLVDDGTDPEGPDSAPFDGEGSPAAAPR